MEIAKVKGCTPVQVLVAYNLIQGLSCVPKSRSAERIEQNFLVRMLKLKLFVRVSSKNINWHACTVRKKWEQRNKKKAMMNHWLHWFTTLLTNGTVCYFKHAKNKSIQIKQWTFLHKIFPNCQVSGRLWSSSLPGNMESHINKIAANDIFKHCFL